MPRNGNGVYSPTLNPEPGATITAASWDTQLADFATALSDSIAKDGQTVPTADLPMGTFKHLNVGNAALRTQYAAAGQVQDSALVYAGTVGGTGNAITISLSPSPAAYAAGQVFYFLAGSDNSGATTVNINGLGVRNVFANGAACIGGEIKSGRPVAIIYDGTQFHLVHRWSPLTTRGDLLLRGASGEQRLALGAANTVLRSDGTDAAWGAQLVLASEAQGDVLYRGASAWSRLAAGTSGRALITGGAAADPAWGDISAVLASGATTSGSLFEVTGIPSWVRAIDIIFRGVSLSGSDNLKLTLGTAGAYVTTGYDGGSVQPTVTAQSNSAFFYLTVNSGASSVMAGGIRLARGASNLWGLHGVLYGSTNTGAYTAGSVALSDALTRLKVEPTGSNTFDAGEIHVIGYR